MDNPEDQEGFEAHQFYQDMGSCVDRDEATGNFIVGIIFPEMSDQRPYERIAYTSVTAMESLISQLQEAITEAKRLQKEHG